MALAGLHAGPGLLLLDEPAAGLAPTERAELMRLVRSLAHGTAQQSRLAVLYTEHNMDAVFGVADRVLQRAIVCQQHQAFAIGIQPPCRIDVGHRQVIRQ